MEEGSRFVRPIMELRASTESRFRLLEQPGIGNPSLRRCCQGNE
jgi:hypothetical protein